MGESKFIPRISILEILADRVELPLNKVKKAAGKIREDFTEDFTTLSTRTKNLLSLMDRL